jgi:predicted ATPase
VDRLDRLPLAIELAAARAAIIPLPILATLIEEGMSVLTARTRDAPARHRTLRDTIAWSYDLLPADAQAFFRRLAVFEGGWTLDAATAVASEAGRDTLADLVMLVEMHLVMADATATDEPRFNMLETIREFGRDCLASHGELDAVRRRHATAYVVWGDAAGPALESREEQRWLLRAGRELPNVRAALGWLRDHGEVANGLRLAAALGPFWSTAGHLNEGGAWLATFLELVGRARRGTGPRR